MSHRQPSTPEHLRILISREQIDRRLAELALQIDDDYAKSGRLVCI